MKTVAIIQARLGSTRCPRKVIREIRGKPLIRYVVERVRQAMLVDEVIVAVPVTDVEEIADAVGSGSCHVIGPNIPEDDVAERFKTVLMGNPCDAFVRICADSPLIDPALIDEVVKNFKEGPDAIVRTVGYPHGQQVEVVDSMAFKVWEFEMKGQHREHVTSWFYEAHPIVVGEFKSSKDFSDIRMVVDTEEDFENMKTLIGKMDRPHIEYGWKECLELQQ